MMEKIKEIVLEEGRPFSYQDFLQFEVNSKLYYMKPGTYRNSVCALRKEGIIETCYNSNIAFHTLKGYTFGNNLMTGTHMRVSSVTDVIPVTARCKMRDFHEYLKANLLTKLIDKTPRGGLDLLGTYDRILVHQQTDNHHRHIDYQDVLVWK